MLMMIMMLMIIILIKKCEKMRTGGIEPPAKPWKGFMLPLHHARDGILVDFKI